MTDTPQHPFRPGTPVYRIHSGNWLEPHERYTPATVKAVRANGNFTLIGDDTRQQFRAYSDCLARATGQCSDRVVLVTSETTNKYKILEYAARIRSMSHTMKKALESGTLDHCVIEKMFRAYTDPQS